MKDSKDLRAVHRKDQEKGTSGFQTVLVPVTDGHSPGVSREKNEIKFYLSAGYNSWQSLENPSSVSEELVKEQA